MIWYRHWVEMRLGVLMFVGLCVWFGVSILGPWRSLEFGQPLPLTPLGQAIGADRIVAGVELKDIERSSEDYEVSRIGARPDP